MSTKRMTANPLRPARYRAGQGAASSSTDSDDSGNEEAQTSTQKQHQQQQQRKIAPPPKVRSAGTVITGGSAALAKTLRDDEARREAARKRTAEAERRAREEGWVSEDEAGDGKDGGEDESEGESGSGEDESEEEESSEEEAPRRIMMRPKFVMKGKNGAGAAADGSQAAEKAAAEAEAKAEAERKAAADAMIEEQIKLDLAAKASGRKPWEAADDPEEEDVDTDDEAADQEAEYALWRVRELKRIRRDREAIEAKEKEREEVERRRNLTDEQRAAEDEVFLAKQREEKEGKGKAAYLQKYFHKGAFYQDESKAEGLDKRDIMGARFQDDVRDRELLPKALQIRDMTKLGKKGASKYKDLKSEDTGQWGNDGYRGTRGGNFGGADRFADERFRPDFYRSRDGGEGGTKANAIPLGERKTSGVPGAPEGPRRDRERDQYRPGQDEMQRRRSRSRSRSRSPRRDRRDDDRDYRKRASSRDRNRSEGDKRRRVEN